ncbi:MAG: Tetrathionate reductase subunit B precursor [Syntrophorhabdus sp. PtaU1.Bin153]|nr:MAG: Tetrathionate reductase subunit B precursor [Syntrophorhabdus sp. PtaU1.Bin153]
MDILTLSRRQFLKAAGVTGFTALLNGCSDTTRTLIPYLAAPEDIIPGKATWYATTCRECPAGCGMLAKNRDGRVVKVEGNPLHPVNTGRLCARGQASVQGVYNPDRYRRPFTRIPKSHKLVPTTWSEAEKTVLAALASILQHGRGQAVTFLTDLTTGSERAVIGRFLEAVGSDGHIMYEPLAYESLMRANKEIFGIEAIPDYRIDEADFLISFGADFLETWVSNVQFARRFARFREPGKNGKNPFLYIGPRLSVTAANADHWIAVPPDGVSVVALGLLHLLLDKNHAPALDGKDRDRLMHAVREFTPQFVEGRTGVKREALDTMAAAFMKARKPLVLAEGMGYQDPGALDTAKVAALLSSLVPGTSEVIDFSRVSSLSRAVRAEEMKRLVDRMHSGEVDLLFILRANPAFHLPLRWGFADAVKRVRLVVSFSSFEDETGQMAHLILPTHTFLESWGDFEPHAGVLGLLQPVTGPMFDTLPLGDMLLSFGRSLKGIGMFPERDFYEVLRRSWEASDKTNLPSPNTVQSTWQEALRRGGLWGPPDEPPAVRYRPSTSRAKQSFEPQPPAASSAPRDLSFFSYPTVQFLDGRSSNRPFLQELPDPITAITWGGWVEINPETAGRLAIKEGDLLRIRSESGSIQAPAHLYFGIARDTLAMPVGHGHSAFGRYATSEFGNPVYLATGGLDGAGGIKRTLSRVTVTRTGISSLPVRTDGSPYQHGREIARAVTFRQHVTMTGDAPEVVPPLAGGFSKERDFYPSHTHDVYRWSMVVDLDRCIGCGACVVACYAENNIAVVGKKDVLKGREMAWLHVQRYFEETEPRVRFLPMMCQHCDEAPCESVCPVFAPHHSREGINNQVYNRCIGTRYCSQNCPYKVRRFNWLTWTHDPPLQWQLNPDVTVRTKGVMEKCSFCIQRIVEAKMKARSENRLVRDGEFAPACAQTCPADALTFGNLKDPHSRVAQLAGQARAYQVLGDLNTKPGVIYLKRITQRII